MLTLQAAQEAAKLIEMDGAEATRTVAQRFGKDIALVLFVAHVRRSLGSTETFPPDSTIDGLVEKMVATLPHLA